jgi:hypothetical protein
LYYIIVFMKRSRKPRLSEGLELATLLAVARLGTDAYGIEVRRELLERSGRYAMAPSRPVAAPDKVSSSHLARLCQFAAVAPSPLALTAVKNVLYAMRNVMQRPVVGVEGILRPRTS